MTVETPRVVLIMRPSEQQQNMVSPLGTPEEIREKKTWCAIFLFCLAKLQLFNKYGTAVWCFILLGLVSTDIYEVIVNFLQTKEIINGLELADVIAYYLCIILSPISLYQLHANVPQLLANYKEIKAPTNVTWMIFLSSFALISSEILRGPPEDFEDFMSRLMFTLASTLSSCSKLLLFGIATSTFRVKCNKAVNGNATTGLSLNQQRRNLLSEFQALKVGCQMWLFVEFTCNTVSLIFWSYLSLSTVRGCAGEEKEICSSLVDMVPMILCLIFYAVTAHDCHSSFLQLASDLR